MAPSENQLIKLLPGKDRNDLLSLAKQVSLTEFEVLSEIGVRARYVYFPIDGFISVLTCLDGKPVLEVGMVGREGLLGAQVALHVSTHLLHAVVQRAGTAWRVPIGSFQQVLERSSPLRHLMGRYAYVLMAQLAAAAACAQFHQIDERLARWLLTMQDRADDDTFAVTHQLLAHMLGVRRASITIAAVALQRQGLIQYGRGHLTVVNRRGLDRIACRCYSDDNQVYARILN